jgi:hypothetical protein
MQNKPGPENPGFFMPFLFSSKPMIPLWKISG